MSGKLAMRVAESGLAAHLKQTAVVYALFGQDDGTRIYPGVARVAWLAGKEVRAIRYDTAALRKLGVLVRVSSGKGGAGKSTHYRLDVSKLPYRPPFKRGTVVPPSGPPPVVSAPANTDVSGSEEPRTLQPIAENPAVHCSRNNQVLESEDKTGASPRALSTAPNDNGNFRVIERVALDLLHKSALGELSVSLAQLLHDEGEFIEQTKTACATMGIDYGREVDAYVVHRACASARFRYVFARQQDPSRNSRGRHGRRSRSCSADSGTERS